MMKTKIYLSELDKELTLTHNGSLLYAISAQMHNVLHLHDDGDVITITTTTGVVHAYPLRTWRVRK